MLWQDNLITTCPFIPTTPNIIINYICIIQFGLFFDIIVSKDVDDSDYFILKPI